jgi:diguanylate cyclase (GGDEF)-like protein/PAS domain S-box-containing protein
MNRCLKEEPRVEVLPFIDAKDDTEVRTVTTEAALDAIVLIDNEWKITYWNTAAETIFGFIAAEALGQDLHGFIKPRIEQETCSREFMQFKVTVKGNIVGKTLELNAVRKDGAEFPAEFSFSSILISDKCHTICIIRDISKRKQIDEAIIRELDELQTMVHERTTELVDANNALLAEIEERKLAETELRKLSLAVEQSPTSIVITDCEGTIEYVNPKYSKITGYTREESIGQNARILQRDDTDTAKYQELWDSITSGREWEGEFNNRKKNGEFFWEKVKIAPVKDAAGVITHLVAIKEDITERKQAELALQVERQRFFSILENLPGFVCLQRPDYSISFANRNLRENFGAVDGRYCYQVFHGREKQCEDCPPYQVFKDREPKVWEVTCINGLTYQINYYSFTDVDGSQQVLQLGVDITERKRLDEALRKSQDELLAQNRQLQNLFQQVDFQAHHDGLTSLPNRLLLADRIHQAILISRRDNHQVAVIFLDLDNFKFINDSLGHEFGDELLKTTAERLTGCVRASDTVARQGGDEFVIIISDTSAEYIVTAIAGKIKEAISRPVTIKGHEMSVTCSIGISIFPKDGIDVQTLIKNADVAMYRAKEMGRDNFQFYSEELNAKSMERMTMERHLRRALENNEFTLHYQPKVSLYSGLITGMEALLRWKNPELGTVSPATFIPLAEETGLIGPIGEWVLRTACTQNRLWQESGLPPMRMAVNVSVCQFKHTNLPDVIGRVLRETRLSPHYLELEITESAVIQKVDKMLTTLNELKEMGIHLAMDDFGSGYASFYYLKQFPFDKLKIDCSFVRDITSNPDSSAIAKAVIAMAHSLRLKVIAEGVETEGQLRYLRDHGCDEMQGYYFSRPVPAAELTELLMRGSSLNFAEDDASSLEKSILIVDDEENSVRALERTLLLDGYRVLTAGSAIEGFELLATNQVAVVISDQWMPGMNGNEFLGKVREIHPNTVRILITAQGDLASVTDAINYGAIFKFLAKPWDNDFLRETVSEAFRYCESLNRTE